MLFLIMLQAILISINMSAQSSIKIHHPDALLELEARTVLLGSSGSVLFKDHSNNLHWDEKDGWFFTKEVEGLVMFAYKVIYSQDRIKTLATIESSTGSADFTDLIQIEVTDSSYEHIRLIAGGDRCHGSVNPNYFAIQDNSIVYGVQLTPNGMMNLLSETEADPYNPKYDDCMICCVAEARYQTNLSTGEKVLQEVHLTHGFDKSLDDKFTLVFKRYVDEKHVILNREELSDFVREVISN